MKVLYIFYYISQEWDSDGTEDFLVEERTTLGAFFDFKTGLEYYSYKYPSLIIKYETVDVLDALDMTASVE